MTTTTRPADARSTTAAAPLRRTSLRDALPATLMVAVVLIGAILPALRTARFYYWDDTAGVAVGVWQRIPAAILAGDSPFLQLDMWRGGNLIAEAATGMWNPVMLGLMFVTHPIDDLNLAITICKITLFVIAALGVYFLARGYGANRWMAAVAGTALPLSGWALFIDGSAWINGSAITAFTPWAWWALRRAMLKRWTAPSIIVAVVCGYLLTSVGNPYGLLTILVAYLALAVEMVVTGRTRSLGWLVATGAITLALSVVVYLPFLLTSSVGFRANSRIENDEFLAVGVSNLLGMSTPSYLPYIKMFGLPDIRTPAMHLAWFVLPALPWLRWRMPRRQLLEITSILVFGAVFLLLVLGPSQFLMFRWPARLIPFLYLAVIVLFAVVATRGFARDRFWGRVAGSVAIVLLGAWLAASDMPHLFRWHLLSIAGTVILGAVFLRWCRDADARTFAVFTGGIVAFLGLQIALAPVNANVADYNVPSSRAALQEGIGERYEGVTIQIANPGGDLFVREPDAGWQDMLVGTLFSVAGVDAVNSYSGVGYNALDAATCMTFNGSTCSGGWTRLWERPDGASAELADLLGLQTVVVQKDFVVDPVAPSGWHVQEETEHATVFARDEPLPDRARVTWTQGVEVASGESVGTTGADVEFTSDGDGGEVVFARIAWPGHTATIDGEPVAVGPGPAGLLQVTVPEGVTEGTIELRFTPPGLTVGLAGMGLGLLGLIAVSVIALRRRRA